MDGNEIELKNSAIIHKDKSLNRLDLSFLKHIELREYKKSELLAYWVHDYAVYHDAERDFDVTKSGVFHRGDVIKVNLGFNIGSELGGLHYCVVLNKKDNPKNGVLNIVPLTSKKEDKKYPRSCVNLGSELYNILNQNIEKENKRLEELLTKLDDLEEIPKTIKESISKEMKYIEQLGKSINQYKKESVVLINQITTISKQRIFYDVVLKNVRLSNESLNLIDEQIIKFLQNKKESCY